MGTEKSGLVHFSPFTLPLIYEDNCCICNSHGIFVIYNKRNACFKSSYFS